jgi:hypothetical protein
MSLPLEQNAINYTLQIMQAPNTMVRLDEQGAIRHPNILAFKGPLTTTGIVSFQQVAINHNATKMPPQCWMYYMIDTMHQALCDMSLKRNHN